MGGPEGEVDAESFADLSRHRAFRLSSAATRICAGLVDIMHAEEKTHGKLLTSDLLGIGMLACEAGGGCWKAGHSSTSDDDDDDGKCNDDDDSDDDDHDDDCHDGNAQDANNGEDNKDGEDDEGSCSQNDTQDEYASE